ncbi:6201_t:CDS:2, partial [Ambispora leptoticha]
YAIRLKKGAEIIQSLEEFARQHESEIGFAEFSMIGSVEEVKLFFSLGYGKGEGGYHPVLLPAPSKAKTLKTSPGKMELLPTNYENLQVFGGHLKEATVALTTEIVLRILSKEK